MRATRVLSYIGSLLPMAITCLFSLLPGAAIAQTLQLTAENGQIRTVDIGTPLVVERSAAYGDRIIKAELAGLTSTSLLLRGRDQQTRTVPLKEIMAIRRRSANLGFFIAATAAQIGVVALNPFPGMSGIGRAAALTGVYAGTLGTSFGVQSILQNRRRWYRLDNGYHFAIVLPYKNAPAVAGTLSGPNH